MESDDDENTETKYVIDQKTVERRNMENNKDAQKRRVGVLSLVAPKGWRNFFNQIPFFAISKKANNQFLNWEKVFKTAKKCNFTKKKIIFDFTSLFDWTF